MRKVLILFLAILLPCFLILEVWGGYRFRKLEEEIQALEKVQEEWIEKNKRLLAGIAVYNSPDRIEKIATEELEMVLPEEELKILLEKEAD